jgi:hypothetical protein
VSTGLFRHWRFRTDKPAFAPGEEIRAYLTGFDSATGMGTVRIGDTELTVTGASAAQLDQLVDLRVESFDAGAGRAVVTKMSS